VFKKILKSIECKFKGHMPVNAGTCPYTNKTYEVCVRCTKMKTIS